MCLYLYEMRKLPLSCPILDLAWHGSWMNLNRNGLSESCTRATRKTGLSSEPLQRMRGLNFKWEKGRLLRKKGNHLYTTSSQFLYQKFLVLVHEEGKQAFNLPHLPNIPHFLKRYFASEGLCKLHCDNSHLQIEINFHYRLISQYSFDKITFF